MTKPKKAKRKRSVDKRDRVVDSLTERFADKPKQPPIKQIKQNFRSRGR